MSRHKPLVAKRKPSMGAIRVWQPFIDAAQRAPSDAKRSILSLRTIGLLDDLQTDFIIAALGLESA